MNDIIIIGLLVLILRSLFNNVTIYTVLRRFQQANLKLNELNEGCNLVLILKVYKEQLLIEETIRYIEKEINGICQVTVMIVGTERERDDTGLNATLNIARNLTQDSPSFTVLEAPASEGTHAWQNNFALSCVKTPPEKTWILTLDIDSRFSRKGIYSFIFEINSGYEVIQQSSLFLSNFNRLGLFQKGHALYQSHWTLAHEIKRILIHNATKLSIAHVVGHGLCINLATVNEFGGFPEETLIEDINLGFYLVAAGKQIRSLDVLEIGDNPLTTLDGLKQEYVWSFGAMNYPVYLWNFIRRFPNYWKKNLLRCLLITLHGISTYLGWLIASWILAGIIVLAVEGNILAVALLLLVLFEFFQCALFFKQLELITTRDLAMSPLYALIGMLRRSIGADVAFIDTLLGRQIKKHKTNHR